MAPATYRELPPPPALARHVACLWYHTAAHESVQPVVPDACADIVVFEGEAPMAVGPATKTVLVELPRGSAVVGVRFRPGMAAVGFGVPARELLDVEAPLGTVCKPALARELEQRLCDARSIERKLAALESFLVSRMPPQRPIDGFVEASVRAIAANPGRPVHDVLPQRLGPRQVLRRFQDAVGYGPKTLQRVLRLQRLLALSAHRALPLGALALDAGYADQPHMTRDMRELTGQTPAALLGRDWGADAMSDFFKTVGAPGF